jgi:thiosulfate dehydrogenase (quinone) large subunit
VTAGERAKPVAADIPPSEATAADSTRDMAVEPGQQRAFRSVFAVTRLSLGWVFLWAFLDKTFALGFSTGVDPETGAVDRFGDAAWINGGSPTDGYLSAATKGPLADFYPSFAGAAWADWLFMLGLLGVGLTMMLGVAMRISAACGALLMVLMWSSALPPASTRSWTTTSSTRWCWSPWRWPVPATRSPSVGCTTRSPSSPTTPGSSRRIARITDGIGVAGPGTLRP